MSDDIPPPEEKKRRNFRTPDGIKTMSEETAQKLIRTLEETSPIRLLRGSQIATAFLGGVGLALFLVGVEQVAQDLPIVDNGWGSIAVGLVFLVLTDALFRRLGGN
jgi:hypothetical protein